MITFVDVKRRGSWTSSLTGTVFDVPMCVESCDAVDRNADSEAIASAAWCFASICPSWTKEGPPPCIPVN